MRIPGQTAIGRGARLCALQDVASVRKSWLTVMGNLEKTLLKIGLFGDNTCKNPKNSL
jgi:hypothetical protein